MRRINALLAAAVTATALSATARAQSSTASVHPNVPVIATAARRASDVVIDGRLSESAWAAATPLTRFTQTQPAEGAPASQRTEVRILYDQDALYVGARMFDSLGRAGVRAPLARRDQLLSGNTLTTDKIAIVLDPYHNHRDRIWFEVNPAGVRGEMFTGDPSFDPVWEAAATIDDQGWSAEMRIPLSQLRFSRDSLQTWGMQLWRYADRLNEQDMWSFRRRNEGGGPAYFGTLDGLTIGARPRQLELLPYVLSRGQFKYASPDDPYHTTRDMGLSVGGDVKYLLTSNLTLDATFNPDFGQVEVDPASLNLSAFETFYDEKRPFFVANRDAFDFGGMNCMFCSNTSSLDVFYSRRIGRPPQLNGYVDDRAGQAGFANEPDNATILGAAKLTGRTHSGFTVGVLDAVANRESALFRLAPAAPELTQTVEPLTNYFVGRVKRDFNGGATTIGTVLTSTTRRLAGDSILGDRLRSGATAAGVDWNHRWGRRQYSWMGSVVASDIEGSPAAITLAERSSAHYFQRPDRGSLGGGLFGAAYDTTATALRG